jgi:hypothetical protein
MIRKALGLGLMLLILKFLMKEVFVAAEDSMVQILNGAGAIFSSRGFVPSDAEIQSLIPR